MPAINIRSKQNPAKILGTVSAPDWAFFKEIYFKVFNQRTNRLEMVKSELVKNLNEYAIIWEENSLEFWNEIHSFRRIN